MEEEPSLRLVQAADGSQVFLDWEGNIVGILSELESAEAVFVTPPQVPGWPARVREVQATPVVGDLDGDGRLEVVFPSISNAGGLYAFRADGTPQPGWPVAANRTGSSASLADIDGDGAVEVFLGTGGAVLGLRSDGSAVPGWPRPISARTVAIDDLDGDGDLELALSRGETAYVLDSNGNTLPGWPVLFPTPTDGASKGPAVGDVDGDGVAEIVLGLIALPSLYLIDLDGTIRPGFPITYPFGLGEGVSMADVDGDGGQELIFEESGGSWILDRDGVPLPGWPSIPTAGNITPAVGDLDGDGRLEAVWGTPGGTAHVYALHDDGTAVAGWPVAVPTFAINPQPTLGDIDGDGGVDVVVGGFTASFSARGRVHAWHADGTPVSGFPFDVPEGKAILTSSVTITDLDLDGDVDLVVGTVTGIGGTNDGRVFAFDLAAPYDPTTLEWPTLGHDFQQTSRCEPPDRAPVPEAGPDLVVECTSPEGALVVLNGSASSDPDVGDEIVAFEWFEDFGLPGQVLLGTGEVLEVVLPLASMRSPCGCGTGPGREGRTRSW
jgi:hypothetical protein